MPLKLSNGLNPIALVKNYDEFMDVVDSKIEEHRFTLATVGAFAGLQPGYMETLKAGTRHFGDLSFDALLNFLGLAMVVVEDPSAKDRLAAVPKRKRKAANRAAPAAMP